MSRINLLVVSAGFLPAESHGGVPYSTFNLCRALADDPQVEVRVVSSDRNGRGRLNLPKDNWTTYEGLSVAYCATWPGSYTYAPALPRILREAIHWADVVISAGTLWDHSGLMTDRLCAHLGKPNLVYPHGLLNGWALHHKRLKKALGMWMQGRRILRRASCIVALSAAEEESVRGLGITTPVAIIPNGAPDAPAFADDESAAALRAGLPPCPYLLFMGRVNKNKGLAQSLAAFRQVLDSHPDLAFLIAGPVDEAYSAEFERLCSAFDPLRVVALGPVSGLRKHVLLQGARGFILTSGGEGVPMAALEAMQYGMPVVVTPECNLGGVAECQAGWVVEGGDVKATADAVARLMTDPVERDHRGTRAKTLARDNYSWAHIARTTRDLLLSERGAGR